MSTFLQLCSDTRRECKINGSGPTSVLAQTGELERVVAWVKNAYIDLQNEQPNWRWLRSEFTVQTVANDDTYAFGDCTDSIASATISRFARWWDEEFQIFLTSAGIATRHSIPFVRWEDHRRAWHTGSQNATYPSEVSIDPRDNLRLGAKPDAIYTLTGEYQKGPQILAADGDTPEMPSRFHQLIVAMAMRRYAAAYAAPEIDVAADRIENGDGRRVGLRLMLEVDQLPEPRWAEPLC